MKIFFLWMFVLLFSFFNNPEMELRCIPTNKIIRIGQERIISGFITVSPFSYGSHINNPVLGFQGDFYHETISMKNRRLFWVNWSLAVIEFSYGRPTKKTQCWLYYDRLPQTKHAAYAIEAYSRVIIGFYYLVRGFIRNIAGQP